MKQLPSETNLLHRTFVLSVGAKGIFGLFELIGAVGAFLISPEQIRAFTTWLTAKELRQEPNNVIAQFILHLGTAATTSETHFVALYLIVHGLTKVVLVWALLRDKSWAYPWMIIALVVFIVSQTVDLVASFSPGIFLLTLFDIFILWLTFREYRLHKLANAKRGEAN